jgi:hypothetical protein
MSSGKEHLSTLDHKAWIRATAKRLAFKDILKGHSLNELLPDDIARLARKGCTDEEISRDVEKIIDEVQREHGDGVYFDPLVGWVTPEESYETNIYASLREISSALKNGADSDVLYSAVERVLYTYLNFIRQGVRQSFGDHKGVSWYIVPDFENERGLINYQDGPTAEWENNCYADEVPVWLLTGLLRRIKLKKPLGDPFTDETIKAVNDAEFEFSELQRRKKASAMFGRGDVNAL